MGASTDRAHHMILQRAEVLDRRIDVENTRDSLPAVRTGGHPVRASKSGYDTYNSGRSAEMVNHACAHLNVWVQLSFLINPEGLFIYLFI